MGGSHKNVCLLYTVARCHKRATAYLAPCWTAAEVLVALLLADPRHLPLKPHGTVQGPPPERYRRIGELLELLSLTAAHTDTRETRAYVNPQYVHSTPGNISMVLLRSCRVQASPSDCDWLQIPGVTQADMGDKRLEKTE